MPGNIVGFDAYYAIAKDNRYRIADVSNRPVDAAGITISKTSTGSGTFDMDVTPNEPDLPSLTYLMSMGADNLMSFVLRALLQTGEPVATGFLGATKTLAYDEADIDSLYKFTGPTDEVGALEMVTTSTTSFTDASAGKILYDLFWDATTFLNPGPPGNEDLGFNVKKYLQLLSQWTFSRTATDSASGTGAWNKFISVDIGPGLTLLDVLDALVDFQMINYTISNGVLSVRNWTLPVLRPGIQLRRDYMTEAPRKIDLSSSMSRVRFGGADDAVYDQQYRIENLTYRSIAGYESQGNLPLDALPQIATLRASKYGRSGDQRTFKYPLNSSDAVPLPFFEFDRGDMIMAYSSLTKKYEPAVVKQITIERASDGSINATIVCNDLIAEATDRIVSAINGITGGSTATGRTTARLRNQISHPGG